MNECYPRLDNTDEQAFSLVQHASAAWPPHILILPVESYAMAPTFSKGDLMVVDTQQRNIREGVYFLSFGDPKCPGTAVQRLQPLPGTPAKVRVTYDNKDIAPGPHDWLFEEIQPHIVGRVVIVEKRL